MFQDRAEAGQRLARRLVSYKTKDPAVIALPRGGVPVGYEVAKILEAPLDILMVRKLGFPGQADFAIGAIADGDKWEILLNKEMVGDDMDLPPNYLEQEIATKLDEMRKMKEIFRSHRPTINITGRTIIAVDDGIATGATMRVMIKRLRRDKPGKIIVATPVASQEAVDLLKKEAEEVVCLDIPENFMAVGGFYVDFCPVTNDEVIQFLDRAHEHQRARPSESILGK